MEKERLTRSVGPALVNTFGVGHDTTASLLIAPGWGVTQTVSSPNQPQPSPHCAVLTRSPLHQTRRTDIG